MSLQDPISDMLTRVRNALMVQKATVSMPASTFKKAVATVLKNEGYIEDCSEGVDENNKPALQITLKYYEGRPVIESLGRVSKPSMRVYKSKDDLPRIQNGLGIAIISTSEGVMTDREARKRGLGGEIVCTVS